MPRITDSNIVLRYRYRDLLPVKFIAHPLPLVVSRCLFEFFLCSTLSRHVSSSFDADHFFSALFIRPLNATYVIFLVLFISENLQTWLFVKFSFTSLSEIFSQVFSFLRWLVQYFTRFKSDGELFKFSHELGFTRIPDPFVTSSIVVHRFFAAVNF